MDFPNLAKPIQVGSLTLKNRLMAAPIVHNFATYDGYTNERMINLYRRKAIGGWALVCVEASYIRQDGRNFNRMHGIYKDSFIGGLSDLADCIHEGGAKASIQIMHAGRIAVPRWTERPTITPFLERTEEGVDEEKISLGELGAGREIPPHQLTIDEVEQIIDAYVDAAIRAKEAGFDMVHLHGAHEFLVSQFMEKGLNKRKDIYGEPSAFPITIIKRMRDALGPDFPIAIRISADEYLGEKGITLEDNIKMVPKFVEAGIDLLDVSAGAIASADWLIQPLYYPRGCITYLADRLKKVVDIPVVGVGRINDPILAEHILSEGKADIVALGRGSVADVDFPRKVFEGRYQEIRKCIACDVCTSRISTARGLLCAVNFDYGRDETPQFSPGNFQSKVVLVVGGGVGGMEAARLASKKGHKVILYEQNGILGGIVQSIAGNFPKVYTKELLNIVEYLSHQMETLGIKLFMNQKVTIDTVEQIKPDVVICATGSSPLIPDIPGIKKSHVFTIDDYMYNFYPLGEKVAIIGGGYGSELAVSLSREKKKVTLLEKGATIAATPYFTYTRRGLLINQFKKLKIDVQTNVEIMEVEINKIVAKDKNGHEFTVEADNVIIAEERNPNDQLLESLSNKVKQVFQIGDCKEPRTIQYAIHEANIAVRSIR